jgi:hypothetical protein
MNKPASAPDVVPPRETPPAQADDVPEGTNATIDHPDDRAGEHPVRPGEKPRSPYVTGNS